MAPVLKTAIVKKTIKGSNPSLSFFFFFFQKSHLLVRSSKKKRIARLEIAKIQGSSWKESLFKYFYPVDMGD
jgi:hypothetical protein